MFYYYYYDDDDDDEEDGYKQAHHELQYATHAAVCRLHSWTFARTVSSELIGFVFSFSLIFSFAAMR